MQDYLLAAVGIAVSIVLFLVGYRQTIGAAQERARAANSALERMLLRRIVQEGYRPSAKTLAILLEGLARDHNVKVGALLSAGQLMTMLYTRIVESDLISPEQRAILLSQLQPAMTEEQREVPALAQSELASQGAGSERIERFTTLLAVVAALAGTLLASLLPSLRGDEGVARPELLLAFVSSLVGVLFVWATLKARHRSDAISADEEVEQKLSFEKNVAKLLRKHRIPALLPRADGYDFSIEADGRRVLIVVKSWEREVPLAVQSALIRRLRQAVIETGAHEGWIIAKKSHVLTGDISEPDIRVLDLDALREQIVRFHGKPSGDSGPKAAA